MLRGDKPEAELRFELFTWGLVLITAAIIYLTLFPILPSLILFIPGLILLGSAIFQDLQPGWRVSWLTYLLAVIVVATGLAGIVNTLLGEMVKLPWLIVAVVQFGLVLIIKAIYDPTPH